MKIYRLVITSGEPAGIGPDLIVQLAQYSWPIEIVVCADGELLKHKAKLLEVPLTLLPYRKENQPISQKKFTLTLLSVPLRTSVNPGKLHIKNSNYVIETLEKACDGCLNGEFAGLVTCPVHKGIINASGIRFIGHTEFFAKRSHTKRAIMMLVNKQMRVALVTTHLPIKDVSNAINQEILYETIVILHENLRIRFGILQPRIFVCGLNPHAGENGYIGTEEIDIIIPVLEKLRKIGMHLSGPFSADTIFQEKNRSNADVFLAMYHDQGLSVVKYQGFGHSVNITLGLPFIRTSVDHGSAIDLVEKKPINAGSLITAINCAIQMINNTL